MPITTITFALGWAVSLFASGFLLLTLAEAPPAALAGLGFGAVVAAFASARLLFLMFAGGFRGERASPHEAPALMVVPSGIVALGGAALSLKLGLEVSGVGGPLLAMPLLGVVAAAAVYLRPREVVDPLAGRLGFARRHWGTDALIGGLVVQPLALLARHVLRPMLDAALIDGVLAIGARGVAGLGRLQDRLAGRLDGGEQ